MDWPDWMAMLATARRFFLNLLNLKIIKVMWVVIIVIAVIVIVVAVSLSSSNKEVVSLGEPELEERLRNTKPKDRRRAAMEYYKKQGDDFLSDLENKYGAINLLYDPLRGGRDLSEGSNYIIDMRDAEKILICETVYSAIGTRYTGRDFPKIIDYRDVVEYEVYEEDIILYPEDVAYTSTTKTNTGSLIKRVAVGAIVAGGVGAVIGGATAERTTVTSPHRSHTPKCCSIRVKIKDRREYICIDRYRDWEGSRMIHYDAWHKYIENIDNILATIIELNGARQSEY